MTTTQARILLPASRLCAALGLSAPELRRLCGNVATRNGRGAACDWTALRASLSKRGLDRWRHGLLSVRTSKHWVAGYPQLVREWDAVKNGDLFPFEVPYGSHRYVWWKCPKGSDHVWRASVLNRTRGGTLCPFCQGRKPSVTNSLASLRPDLVKEWDVAANRLSPSEVTLGAARKVAWRCARGHTWRAVIANRAGPNAAGCPMCALERRSDRKPRPGRSLADSRLPVVHEWHPTRNGNLTPKDVARCAKRKVWWKCPRDPKHEWRAVVSNRTRATPKPSGCPRCAREHFPVLRPRPGRSLKENRPEVAREWHPTLNLPLRVKDISVFSARRVWWRCSRDPSHIWRTNVGNRTSTSRTGCPRCAVLDRRVGLVKRFSGHARLPPR